ncbi:YceI family protein [Aquincola sp. J276]|uniref:YceI family protein n=1 Tax=Aquincola sp. J276 TaxID=2898432 RepID=UPI002151AEB8|nr:YceI family protein [Aquincola sp. J276]MCR5868181.1 YceI family protein [Aquincola sp. J276]
MTRRRYAISTLLFIPALLVMAGAVAGDAAPIEAPAGTYILEKEHASLTWRVRHMGLSNYTARFKRFDTTIRFDPADFARSSVQASVDLGSIETDFVPAQGRDFNVELRSEPFFNVAKFPRATFTSTKVIPTGPRTMQVEGRLDLLGVSQPVTLTATLNGALKSHPFAKVPALGFSITGQVPRLAFGFNPPPVRQGVGEVVDIAIEAEFVQQP